MSNHRNRLAGYVNAFSGLRITVIGDVMLDEYIWGDVRRISPEAPVPVLEVRRRSCVPGGAANDAVNVRSLSGGVRLGGLIGQDANADELRAALAFHRIDGTGLVRDSKRPTTTKTRLVAGHHQIARMDVEERQPIGADQVQTLLNWTKDSCVDSHAIILSDYAKGVVSVEVAQSTIAMARGRQVPVVVDPKAADFSRYRGATIVTPNLAEAQQATGIPITSEGDVAAAGQRLMEIVDGAVLLTRGADGMALFQPDMEPIYIASSSRKVYDVTGAGDTVTAALALALAAGATLSDAALLANLAAGIVVGKPGTASITTTELLDALEENE